MFRLSPTFALIFGVCLPSRAKELEGEKEIGFFPLALIPLTFDNSLEGKVFCCMERNHDQSP